jgi:hypothetical protein
MSNSLSDLAKRLMGSRDGVLPGIQNFPALDVPQISAQLDLEARGTADGGSDQPPSDGEVPSSAESDVQADIERRARKGAEEYLSQLSLYDGRIGRALASTDVRADIEAAGNSALTEFRIQAEYDLDRLKDLRREVAGRDQELEEFRSSNRMRRLPHIISPTETTIRLLVLGIAVTFELILNGHYFAQASDLGLIGGVSQALVFSFLNVGVAFGYGLLVFPLLLHRQPWIKLAGAVFSLGYLAVAAVGNVLIGLYRDLYIEKAGVIAVSDLVGRFAAMHFDVQDPNSWLLRDAGSLVLAVLGFAISIVSAIDAIGLRDPYPRYGHIGAIRARAVAAYVAEKGRLLREFMRMRDGRIEEMSSIIAQIRRYDLELRSALDNRKASHKNYVAYLDHLADSYARLIQIYRAANAKTRSTPPPTRFQHPPPRPNCLAESSLPDISDQTKDERAECVQRMQHFIVAINQECETAVQRLHTVDALTEAQVAPHVAP